MFTDSSRYGIDGVLLQHCDDGTWRPVSFMCRKITNAELNFTETERKCPEVLHWLRKWGLYLHGERKLVVEMENLSLKWLMSLKDPHGRLSR